MATGSFTNFSAPSVDGQALRRQLAPVLMNNIVQKIIQYDGRGVTEEFSTDTNAIEIRVVREKPLVQNARQFGKTVDGGYFSSQTPEQPTSDEYGIRVWQVWDTPVDIPANMQDMFPLDIVGKTLRNIAQAVAKNINASTTAEQLTSYFNYNKGGTLTDYAVVYDSSTDSFLDKFWEASSILDDGDETNGVDTFPLESRICIVRTEGKYGFGKGLTGVFNVDNWKAQDMLAVGAISPDVMPNTDRNGYLGNLNSTEVYFQANAVWTLAGNYMADASDTKLTANVKALTIDAVVGYLASKEGTGRAIAFDNTVKTIDSPDGQGIRLQPKYRWGHETWFPKSIVAIVDTTFTLEDATYPWVNTNQVVSPGSSS